MSERRVLLLLILLLLAALKWEFTPGVGRNSLDGDYYFQVARHVAEGDGLKTSVSLYHQGLHPLPQPTNIYPLWPLVLGLAGRILNLPLAAALLPKLLYLLDLLLLYLLAERLALRIAGDAESGLLAPGGAFGAGHLAVLLFGLNPVFFNFTSLPYTEALAFAFLFASLLALDRAVTLPSLAWSAAAGGLATLAFMTRSQMVFGVVVVVGLLAAAATPGRRLRAAAASAGTGALLLAPWVAYLATFVKPFTPRAMLSIGAFRQTPEIAPFQWNRAADSGTAYLLDRMSGLLAALDPTSASSYVESHGLIVWLVPLALGVAVVSARDLAPRLRPPLPPATVLPVASVLAGLLMVAPLHLLHTRFLSEWRFGHRHGLPLILVLVPLIVILARRPQRGLRWITWTLVAVTLATGAFRTVHLLRVRFPSGLLGPEPELVEWLDAQQPRPAVVTTNAQTLSVFSRAGFHWMECREDPAKTRQLVELAGADYVLVYAGEERCAFSRGLDEDFERVREFRRGPAWIAVWAPRGR